MYEVRLENRPVFILELRPPGELRYGSKRQEADLRIRRRIMLLRRWPPSLICSGTVLTAFNSIDNCPLPVLHAVSVFGTQLCFYSMHRDRTIEPRRIPTLRRLLHEFGLEGNRPAKPSILRFAVPSSMITGPTPATNGGFAILLSSVSCKLEEVAYISATLPACGPNHRTS